MPFLTSRNGSAVTTPDASTGMASQGICGKTESQSKRRLQVDPVGDNCICPGNLQMQDASQKSTPAVDRGIEARLLQRCTVTRSLLAPLDPILEDTGTPTPAHTSLTRDSGTGSSCGNVKNMETKFLAPPVSDVNIKSFYPDHGTNPAPPQDRQKDLASQPWN